MRVPGLRRLRAAARWLRGRFGTRGMILGYHTVAAEGDDPFEQRVTPARFAEQMEVIARRAHPLPADELVAGLREGRLPSRAVAVTFDDGYADLLYAANPVLERHAIPATAFFISGWLGEELWWDRLRRLVTAGTERGEPLRLALPGETFQWRSGLDAAAEPLFSALYARFRGLPGPALREALAALQEWAGNESSTASGARTLRPDEIHQLLEGGLVRAGAHTENHPDLTTLGAGQLEAEIAGSRARLSEVLDREIVAFSYPFGRYSAPVASRVREAGFTWACRSGNDLVRPAVGDHELPRFWPGDWEGDRFGRWLRGWLG